MMTTTFIGVDLAWQSSRNPSGFAVLQGDRSGAELNKCRVIQAEEDVAEVVLSHATTRCVVAIDAPLIILNEVGQRSCETEIGKRYGSREASCHTTNLTRYKDAASVALTAVLARHGFVHATLTDKNPSARIMMEVYPHAAMVALWNLPKTIKYKKGSVEAKRDGLKTLRTRLAELSRAVPSLTSTHELTTLLGQELDELRGRQLKSYEDQLDALFCSYLAYYFWYWGGERNEFFGDCDAGYILNPKLTPLPN